VISALLGFFLATIGSDPVTGVYRFTFGITILGGGFRLSRGFTRYIRYIRST
jgi:TctA family transporter